MKRFIFIATFAILLFSSAIAHSAERTYRLNITSISSVNFKNTYQAKITYTSGINETPVTILQQSDFNFKHFDDSKNYVSNVVVNGSTFYITFCRRDTPARINGTLYLYIDAKAGDDSSEKAGYCLELPYTYIAMTSTDPGEISAPQRRHEAGELPGLISSVYSAIPLKGNNISYSWERRVSGGEWSTVEGETGETLYPKAIGRVSEFYRRKATDSYGNSAYSNEAEVLATFNAGKIGISNGSTDNIIILKNVVSPDSDGAAVSWQSSSDLETWLTIGGSLNSLIVSKPAVTTYYRRTVTSQTNDAHGVHVSEHSNIVCYQTESPLGIESKNFYSQDSCVSDIDYYDGLGRPLQSVAVSATADGKDIVTAQLYDGMGRIKENVVPFTHNGNGDYLRDALTESSTFHGDSHAAESFVYEDSPLERVARHYNAGEVFRTAGNERFKICDYGINEENEILNIALGSSGEIAVEGYCTAGTLERSTATDEDGISISAYTDAAGSKLIERRMFGDSVFSDTYFVYDAKRRLCRVIQPNGSSLLKAGDVYAAGSTFEKEHCFVYEYDNDDRMVMRRLPGKCAEFFEYDTGGRLTACYDEDMAADGIKKKFSYDAIGRAISVCYGNNGGNCCQIRNYYDSYPSGTALGFAEVAGVVSGSELAANVQGMLTHEHTFELFSSYANEKRERSYYYDKLGRCVQTVTSYPLGIMLRRSVKYDYMDNPVKVVEEYSGGGDSFSVVTECVYDKRGRLIAECASADDSLLYSAEYEYDARGKIVKRRLNDILDVRTYYNLQGWVKSISCDVSGNDSIIENEIFRETLCYYDAADSLSVPLYAGRIAEQAWGKRFMLSGNDMFVYGYDGLGRLARVEHRIKKFNNRSSEGDYSELYAFDRNGNIVSSNVRRGDSCTLNGTTFKGNRIDSLYCNGAWIGCAGYDSRGNITKIPAENLQIEYNVANLPHVIVAADGKRVTYSYLADGTKFRAVSDNGTSYVYTDALRWRIEGNSITPESFALSAGRAVYENGEWLMRFHITDHIGSVRAVTDGGGNLLATYDYTPYGELLSASDSIDAGGGYLFTGKESQKRLGVDELYDSHARFMNTKGRFLSIDPMAEKYCHLSPYSYCAADPVNLIDPDGRKIFFAKGVPDWFKERFAATIKYMNERGTSWIFKRLQDSETTYYIDYVEKITKDDYISYSIGEKTIYWNPDFYLKSEESGNIMFPATILAHEGAHALQNEKYGEQKLNELRKIRDDKYGNIIEREVITTTEQYVAKRHEDETPTRADHGGVWKIVSKAEYKEIFKNEIPHPLVPERHRDYILTHLMNRKW